MDDELNIKSSSIENIIIENNKIIITVNLYTKYMDYIIDNNGKVISGNANHRIENNYTIILEKEIEMQTQGIIRYCESCGASIDVNKSRICPFCRTEYKQSKHDYIITNIY